MKGLRALWILPPLGVLLILLTTYLVALPRAVRRAERSPCARLGLEPVKTEVKPAELELADLRGERPLALKSLRGRLVLLNFWFTGCDPCIEELPSLIELAERYRKRGLVLLMVSTDKKASAVQKFVARFPRLAELPSNAMFLHDPGGKLAHRLGTFKYPETYLVSNRSAFLGRVVGARNWIARSVTTCLTSHLPH